MKKRILFVCPTNRWEARERSMFDDMQTAYRNNFELVFYGLKSSPLDKKIQFDGVEKHYHPGLVQTHFFLWPKLKGLSKLVDDKKLSLVHCYKLNILWPICFFLRGNRNVSLILSQYFELKKNYRSVWHRLLIRRCDLVFVPYHHLIKNVWSRLGVHPRKIQERPPNLIEPEQDAEEGVIFEKFEQFYSVGVYVSDSDKKLEKFEAVIKALSVANEHLKWKKPIKLVFVTEGSWGDKTVHQKLKQKVLDEGIEEHIVFYAGGPPANYIQYFNLWMTLPKGEGLDDLSLVAISIGTPILVPRHPSTSDFFSYYGHIGETYKADDVREITRKWEMILSNSDFYQDRIELASQKVRRDYSRSSQENQYFAAMKKVTSRRERYLERRVKRPSL